MAASWNNRGGRRRFDIPDGRCALWPAEGLAIVIAGSERRNYCAGLLLATQSIEQRAPQEIWLNDPQDDQSS
jgi:hypothetical protein